MKSENIRGITKLFKMNHRMKRYILALCAIVLFFSMVFYVKGTNEARISAANLRETAKKQISLTKEEQEYIKNHPVITVAGDASWRPLEYENQGKYQGVIYEILDRLEDYTGFRFKYKVMDSYSKALSEVQSGNADIVSGLANDKVMARKYNVNLSKPYLVINSSLISKNDISSLYKDSKLKKVAVVAGDYANEEIEDSISNIKLIECASNEECLEKVKEGNVDLAIIASYCAEYYMTVPKYSELKSHTISDFSWDLSFGVNAQANPILMQILNKGITQMAEIDLNEAVYEGVVGAAYDNDFVVFVYKHPILVISIIVIIVLIIGSLLLTIFVLNKKDNMRKIEDGTRLKLALERTNLCIWEIDLLTMSVTKINNEHEKHGFGDLRENIPESIIEAGMIHPDDVMFVRDALDKVKRGEQNVQGCWRIKERTVNSNDTLYWWEQVLFQVVYDNKNQPIKTIGVSEDVTKEKNAQRDSLTLVYNRNSFEQKASLVLNERRNAYLQCAYLILDLDGFKQINDSYGHGMGDRVLISVGTILNKTFRSSDIVGRLGGDEFTVFMTSISKVEDAKKKAQEVIENIRNLETSEGYPFSVSCSLGVVVGIKGEEQLENMYKKADIALYDAKRSGKNQYRLYE